MRLMRVLLKNSFENRSTKIFIQKFQTVSVRRPRLGVFAASDLLNRAFLEGLMKRSDAVDVHPNERTLSAGIT